MNAAAPTLAGGRTGDRRGAVGLLLIGLIAVEAAWFGWFLTVPLLNASRATGPGRPAITRGLLLLEAVPGIAPGRSVLGEAARALAQVENLPQRLPLVLAAAAIAAGAVGLGRLMLRGLRLLDELGPLERTPLAFGLGAAGLGVATLGLGRLGGLGPWPVRLGLGALTVAGFWPGHRNGDPGARTSPRPRAAGFVGAVAVSTPFLVLMVLAAMLPTIEYDALSYHLQAPKEYFQAGRIAFLPHNVYSSMPLGVEMLHLLGMEVLDDWWLGALAGQVTVALFAPAAAALVAATAWRWGSPRASAFAALVYLTTPWVYRVGALPFVEGPLCYDHAALLWAAVCAGEATGALRVRFWVVAGLMAGGALACKYPALVTAVVPFGLVAAWSAWRSRSGAIVAAFAVGVLVVAGPWLARNAADTGNPVYPLGYRVFGGRYWDADREARWERAHGPRPVSARALAASVAEVAGQSDWQSPLYVALAPLAALRRGSRRRAALLAGYVAFVLAGWWLLTHRLERFWLPALPAAAVLAGLGADWTEDRRWTAPRALILALAWASNLVLVATPLTAATEWTADLRVLRAHALLARLDAVLPPRARVLCVGQASVFHVRHPLIYNTVFAPEAFEELVRGRTAAEARRALAARGITHVFVDWGEIRRLRAPGNYGFSPFITPEQFARLVRAGTLEPPQPVGMDQELYRVSGGG